MRDSRRLRVIITLSIHTQAQWLLGMLLHIPTFPHSWAPAATGKLLQALAKANFIQLLWSLNLFYNSTDSIIFNFINLPSDRVSLCALTILTSVCVCIWFMKCFPSKWLIDWLIDGRKSDWVHVFDVWQRINFGLGRRQR